MLDMRKEVSSNRMVLVPQTTVIRFDLDDGKSLFKSPQVPFTKEPSKKISINVAEDSAKKLDERVSYMIDKFIENSSTTNISGQNIEVVKTRVVEEMLRIHQRAQVTAEERRRLLHYALSMETPKLSRKLVREVDELRDESNAPAFLTGNFMEIDGCIEEKGNQEEDESFCKAFDEVERIRKRIMARASVNPLDISKHDEQERLLRQQVRIQEKKVLDYVHYNSLTDNLALSPRVLPERRQNSRRNSRHQIIEVSPDSIVSRSDRGEHIPKVFSAEKSNLCSQSVAVLEKPKSSNNTKSRRPSKNGKEIVLPPLIIPQTNRLEDETLKEIKNEGRTNIAAAIDELIESNNTSVVDSFSESVSECSNEENVRSNVRKMSFNDPFMKLKEPRRVDRKKLKDAHRELFEIKKQISNSSDLADFEDNVDNENKPNLQPSAPTEESSYPAKLRAKTRAKMLVSIPLSDWLSIGKSLDSFPGQPNSEPVTAKRQFSFERFSEGCQSTRTGIAEDTGTVNAIPGVPRACSSNSLSPLVRNRVRKPTQAVIPPTPEEIESFGFNSSGTTPVNCDSNEVVVGGGNDETTALIVSMRGGDSVKQAQKSLQALEREISSQKGSSSTGLSPLISHKSVGSSSTEQKTNAGESDKMSAIFAAFSAGDAVGKLMADMMVSKSKLKRAQR